MNHAIRSLIAWWNRRHPPCAKIPEWRAGYLLEKRALATGCTRDVGRARKMMRTALHSNMARRG